MEHLGAIGQLIFAVAALLAVVVVGFVVVFRPDRILRFRHRDSELEFLGSGNAQPQEEDPGPEERSATEKPPAREAENEEAPEKAEHPWFATAFHLFQESRFDEGLALIRDEANGKEDPREHTETMALGYYFASVRGHAPALSALKNLAERNPETAQLRIWHGMALHELEYFEEATRVFRDAFEIAESEKDSAGALVWMTRSLESRDLSNEAVQELCSLLPRFKENEPRAALLTRLGELRLKLGHRFEAFAAYERAVALTPADSDRRFNLAYAYSEHNAPRMALTHYKTLIQMKRDHPMALNNAGVAAEALDLPGTAMAYYRKSEDMGNTLAVTNIAYQLMSIGLYDKAQESLEAAMRVEDAHENVLSALGAIVERKKREEDKVEGLAEEARAYRAELSAIADATLKEEQRWRGVYENENGDKLSVTQEDRGGIRGVLTRNSGKEVEMTGRPVGGACQVRWKTLGEEGKGLLSIGGIQKGHGFLRLDDGVIVVSLREGDHSLDLSRGGPWTELTLSGTKGERQTSDNT